MSKGIKKWLVAATAFILAGGIIFVGVMTVLKWNFKKLTTFEYETNEYTFTENYSDIFISSNMAQVEFIPYEAEETKVVCYEITMVKHKAEVKENTLYIEAVDNRKWHEYLNINFDLPKITVYIPLKAYGKLSVKAETGDVIIPKGYEFEQADIRVTTGKINVSGLSCVSNAEFSVTTGKINICDVTGKNISFTGSTGDVHLKNVVAAEKLSIKTNTGDIQLSDCDGGEIFIKNNTGSVNASLLSEKIFIADTTTGKVKVPKTVSGGKCEITTTTGNITVEIVK